MCMQVGAGEETARLSAVNMKQHSVGHYVRRWKRVFIVPSVVLKCRECDVGWMELRAFFSI